MSARRERLKLKGIVNEGAEEVEPVQDGEDDVTSGEDDEIRENEESSGEEEERGEGEGVMNQIEAAEELAANAETGDDQMEDFLGNVDAGVIPDPNPNQQTKKKRSSRKPKGVDIRIREGVPKKGPFPGGPIDCDILPNFYDHVALNVWFGEERGPLTCNHHTLTLRKWKVGDHSARFKEKVKDSGLDVLQNTPHVVDKSLISAFVERWHPETSSFHLPFGEMSITLDDVREITGLKIHGDLFMGTFNISEEEGVRLVERCLGVPEEDTKAEFKESTGACNVRLTWIFNKFSNLEEVDQTRTDYKIRAYMLYAIGCVLCPNKSGNKVSVAYLKYLENVDELGKYAWGAIALAFLYKELSNASRNDVRQIAGYLALLEVWFLNSAHFTNLSK